MKEKEVAYVPDERWSNFSFNMTDVIILLEAGGRELSISELQKEVGVAYKNLSPHIKKLEKYNLLKIKDNGKGRKKTVSLNLKDFSVASLIVGLIDFFMIPHPSREEAIKTIKEHEKR